MKPACPVGQKSLGAIEFSWCFSSGRWEVSMCPQSPHAKDLGKRLVAKLVLTKGEPLEGRVAGI